MTLFVSQTEVLSTLNNDMPISDQNQRLLQTLRYQPFFFILKTLNTIIKNYLLGILKIDYFRGA